MKIVVVGPKCSGKSCVGKMLAENIGVGCFETDDAIENLYAERTSEKLSCRDIFKKHGEKYFRDLERAATGLTAGRDWSVICTGGSTMLNPELRRLLRVNSVMVFLKTDVDVLWERMQSLGLPAYLDGADPKAQFAGRIEQAIEVVLPFADVVIETGKLSIEETAEAVLEGLEQEFAVRSQSANTFGQQVRVTTFGESHGVAIGAILDGVKPGVEICEADIQKELNRRRPGQSKVATARNESDQVKILSGVFEGKTTGASIGLLIENQDQDSSKYDNLRDVFRPGHADYTFWKKYGIRDHRGGGRSSGRETACRVAGGAIAKKILAERGVQIVAHATEVAGIAAAKVCYDEIEKNPVRTADPDVAKQMEQAIIDAKKDTDSVGGIIQLDIKGLPAGLGDPVFGKLQARLGAAMLSIGTVKGVEFGIGFKAAKLRGSECNDQMKDGKFLTNNAGGVLGGMSNGDDVLVRLVIKPTASIVKEQQTSGIDGKDRMIRVEGRHDPCIVPRAVPVVESMAALVLLDMWQIQEGLRPGWDKE